MKIRVLRSLEVDDGHGRALALSATQRRLLAYLAIHPDEVMSAERLADVLDTSVRALHMTVLRVRKAAGHDAIITIRGGYLLHADDIDIRRFEWLVQQAQQADPGAQVTLLGDALALWAGPAFGELGEERWAQPEAVRLGELRANAIEDRADALMSLGRFSEVGPVLIAHIAERPLRDRPRGLLMRSLAAQGRLTEALRAFQEYRTYLADEAGITPSDALRELEARLVTGWHDVPDPDGAPMVARPALVGPSPGALVVPLPSALARSVGVDLVGRQAELALLESEWDAARSGQRRVVLVGGEAGAGKTRLALELARRCAASGGAVLYGACDAELAIPYRPWVEILEHLIRALPADLVRDLTDELSVLSLLLPTIEAVLPGVRPPEPTDPETDRYRMFRAIDRMLVHVTMDHPLVVIVDDLHWGDTQTLALLRHLGKSEAQARMLLVATFRDAADEITEQLTDGLADLHRNDATSRMTVHGLDRNHVTEFVASLVGHALDPELTLMADALAERSAGNPFYLGELWRHFESIGAVAEQNGRWLVRFRPSHTNVPDTLRDVVAARLARLRASTRAVAELLAVAGLRIDLKIVRAAHDAPPQDLAVALNELVRAHVLAAVSSGPVPVYQFAHAIVRDTIVRDIELTDAALLHQRIARAYESVHATDLHPVLADLSRHFTASASIGDPRVAVHYARLAAAQAVETYAYEEASVHLDAAAALAEPGSRELVDVLLDRAEIATRAGLDPHALASLSSALRHSLDLGLADQAARAAIALETARQLHGLPASDSIERIEEVLRLPAFTDARMRMRVRAALVNALHYFGRHGESTALAETLLTEARALGDVRFLVSLMREVLTDTNNTSTDPERVLRADGELCVLAESIDDLWSFCWGAGNVVRSLLMLGRTSEARSALERHRKAAERGRYDLFRYQAVVFDAVIALIDARFEDAERHATVASELFSQHTGFDSGVYGLQMYMVRRGQGRLAEVAPLLQFAARSGASVWRPGLAALFSQLGRRGEAEREFAVLAADGFASIQRDSVWPACLAFICEVCAFLGDTQHADVLYRELEPFAGLTIMVAYTVCLGPADTLLGALAALLGRVDQAAAHFRTALDVARRSGSPVWVADVERTCEQALGLDTARALCGRESPHRAR